jgi:hypothetical protein
MFGTGMVWLSPGVPRSVAPRAIPELAVDWTIDPASAPLKPGVAEVVPDELELLVPAELHPEEDTPPPSNEAFELVLGHGILSGLIPG